MLILSPSLHAHTSTANLPPSWKMEQYRQLRALSLQLKKQVWTLLPLFSISVSLGNLLNLSVSQFPHLQKWEKYSAHLTGSCEEKWVTNVRCLEHPIGSPGICLLIQQNKHGVQYKQCTFCRGDRSPKQNALDPLLTICCPFPLWLAIGKMCFRVLLWMRTLLHSVLWEWSSYFTPPKQSYIICRMRLTSSWSCSEHSVRSYLVGGDESLLLSGQRSLLDHNHVSLLLRYF